MKQLNLFKENGGTPLRLMRQASWNLIMNIMPNGTYVGIVSIGDETWNHINKNLTKIISKSDRENIVAALPSVADANGRCVGCGIRNALEVTKLTF